jgi:hypothetical protein
MNILDRIAAKITRRTESTALAVGSTDGPGPTQAPNAAANAVAVAPCSRFRLRALSTNSCMHSRSNGSSYASFSRASM